MSKKILLIDDEVALCRFLKKNVELNSDYEVMVAHSGSEGLEQVQKGECDLVLLDIMMPGMNGLETLKRIKAVASELPVAMVTAVWDEEEAKKCFKAGAYEYITKPIDLDYLKRALLVKLFG